MPSQGSVVARVFTSNAMLPVAGAQVSFFAKNAYGVTEQFAFRITDADGFTAPVLVDTPDDDGATLTDSPTSPYAIITITAEHPNYDRIIVEDAQIFANTRTVQQLMFVPASGANGGKRTESYIVPKQEL